MPTLSFAPSKIAPILNGECRSAVRLERRGMFTGQRVTALSRKRPFAELQLTACRLVEVGRCHYHEAARLKAAFPSIERAWVFTFRVVGSTDGG